MLLCLMFVVKPVALSTHQTDISDIAIEEDPNALDEFLKGDETPPTSAQEGIVLHI